MTLKYPLAALISPIIHELPEVATIRQRNHFDRGQTQRQDWVDPRKKRDKVKPPPPTQQEKKE